MSERPVLNNVEAVGCMTLLGRHNFTLKLRRAKQQFAVFLSAAGTHCLLSIARLKAASQEAEAVRREQTVWERKVGELQARCTTLEEEKYEALAKVRESVQVAEEAALQKDQVTLCSVLSLSYSPFSAFFSGRGCPPQTVEAHYPPYQCPHPLKCVPVFTVSLQALLREKQKAEELEKTKEAIKQLIQDAAVRTRKEVNGSLSKLY